MDIFGLDVSHYQGVVDFARVKASGISFAFAKATEGLTVVDPQFAGNWRGIQQAGLYRGAYHFGHPGSDPEAQAAQFFATVGELAASDLPPVLDIETSDGHPAPFVVQWILAFVRKAESLFARPPILYTGGFFRNTLGDPNVPELSAYPLWLASYRSTPLLPKTWSSWTFWQYSDGSIGNPPPIAGVQGSCDRSRFAGDVEALQALIARKGSSLSTPAKEPARTVSWPGRYFIYPAASPAKGDDVRTWQQRMSVLGFVCVADGIYGPSASAACRAFQREHGLNVDGIVGPQTWNAAFSG